MNKMLPFVLIVTVVIAGVFLKLYLDQANNAPLNQSDSALPESGSNKIDNRYETILIYPKKNLLPDFELKDQSKAAFNNEHFKGRWNLIFIGYTNCPDVCPNTLNQMTQLYHLLDQGTRSKFQFVFLTVDPERDTPDHLTQYLDFFDAEFVGLSGETSQLDPLVKALGGVYSLNKDEGEFYTVDHSARIFLVGPKADRYGILESSSLSNPDKKQLVKDLVALAK